MIPYRDLYKLSEDERIGKIGEHVVNTGDTVAVVTDADPGKAERYIKKLTTRFPGVIVLGKGPGPVKKTITIKVGPKSHSNN